MRGIRVVALNLHPVKSTAIRPVASAQVTYAGLAGDRRWMVVDGEGELLTAREDQRLFSVTADTAETVRGVSGLRLSAPGVKPLDVAEPEGSPVQVRLHGKDLRGVPLPAEASRWLGAVLGRDDLRIVWCDDPTRRPLNPAYSRPGDHTAFPDGYPVTLASLVSLRQLNDWMAETAAERGEPVPAPLPIQRFRPNIVVHGDLEPFAEDGWAGVRVGDVPFRLPKGVDRCVMTTIDPQTLERGHEPIRTLARHRRWDGVTWFAVQLIPDATGTVRVGDPVTPG